MSIRNLFDKKKTKVLADTVESVGTEVESGEYVKQYMEDRDRFVPSVNFGDPTNFAKFGSAEMYYQDSISRITGDYPFDGSLKEKIQFHNSSSNIDNWIFDNCSW